MKTFNRLILFFAIIFFATFSINAQTTAQNNSQSSNTTTMKTYLIERDIPDAGKFTPDQLKSISQKSCSVLKDMGPQIQWIQSYVTGDKIFCVYKAASEDLIREHGKKGGFPVTTITEINNIISPETAKN